MADAVIAAPIHRFSRKQIISFSASIVLVVAIFWFVLPQVADFSKVWAAIRDMSTLEIGILALLAAWNLVTYWIVTVAATPGLKYRQAVVLIESSTAVANTVPGGSVIAMGLTYSMLGAWGFSKSRSTLSLVVSGLWNNFVKLGMPVLALSLLALQGNAGGGRVVAGVIGIFALTGSVVLFALMLRSEDFSRRAGEAAGRAAAKPLRLFKKSAPHGWGDATVKFRNRVIGLVRHSWVWLTVSSLIGHLSLYAVLLVTLRDVGVSNQEVNWIEVLAVFAFVRLITAIPLTPGGLGVVELGMIGGLTAAGGNHEQVVAAVLVYRLLTYVLPIGFGVLTYLFYKRNKSWLETAPPLDAKFTPATA